MIDQQILEPQTDFCRDVLDQVDDGVYVVDLDRRIAYWNKGAENISGYSNIEAVGARCPENILRHVDSTGRPLCSNGCPMMATMTDGSPRQAAVFLHHKDGYRVPINVRVSALRDGHGKIIGGMQIFSDNCSRIADLVRIKELESVTYIDPLTGTANRRYIQVMLEARLAEKERYNWQFGTILFDIDHFKKLNDLHGYETGDRVLQMVARTLNHSTRPFDLVGRWGREEFLVIVTNVNEQNLGNVADKLRILVEQSSISTDTQQLSVTVSAGATIAKSDDNPESLLNRADELMHQSKAAGRNRITIG